MGNIDWIELGELPDTLKDGREVLAYDGAVVTAQCNPHGIWFRTDRGQAVFDGVKLIQIKPSHCAEINEPN